VLAIKEAIETAMNTPSPSLRGPRSAALLLAVGAAVAAIAFGAAVAFGGASGAAGPANPSTAPSVAPSAAPATPSAVPSAAPSAGSDAMPITVNLDNATNAEVRVDIVDHTQLLVDAESGTPGDGMSVEPYTLKVENLDATTLKLTWVDFGIDNALALFVDKVDGGYRLLLIQPEPTSPTDAMGFDRELVLSFSEPISASQVEAFLQGGLDTPG
jgi:hypothetical protein